MTQLLDFVCLCGFQRPLQNALEQESHSRMFGDGVRVLFGPSQNGEAFSGALYTDEYVAEIVKKFIAALSSYRENWASSESKAREGLAVFYSDYDDESSLRFRRELLRFSFPVAIKAPKFFGRVGPQLIGTEKNKIVTRLREWSIRRPAIFQALRSELSASINRTPVLLPFGNFFSNQLMPEIDACLSEMEASPNPQISLATFRKLITQKLQFGVAEKRKGRPCFRDERDLVFSVPGRYLHGIPRASESDVRQLECVLRGRWRCGVGFHPAFHYDCSLVSGGVPVNLKNCEWELVPTPNAYRGYVNIAPNDHLR